MFLLLGLGAGLLVGFLRGGRLDGLAEHRFRLAPLAIAGLLVQVVLFADPVASSIGEAAGRSIYVLSTAVVLAALLANLPWAGIPVAAVGAALNLTAIVANGGVMPADPGAVERAGLLPPAGFSNSAIVDNPALAPLTDVFAVPAGWPLATVFSVGDVLIGVGLAWAIAWAMGRRRG